MNPDNLQQMLGVMFFWLPEGTVKAIVEWGAFDDRISPKEINDLIA